MANLQRIADRIFHYVDRGFLSSQYAVAMGALVDVYNQDPIIHGWVNAANPSLVEKLIACIVRHNAQPDVFAMEQYIKNHVRSAMNLVQASEYQVTHGYGAQL